MAFAEKYRKSLADSTQLYLDKDFRNKSVRKSLDEEEKKKKDEWKLRRKKLVDEEAKNELNLVSAFGNVVMASGFVDAYPDDFSLLSGILAYALEQLGSDPGAAERYRSCSLLRDKDVAVKVVKGSGKGSVASSGGDAKDNLADVV